MKVSVLILQLNTTPPDMGRSATRMPTSMLADDLKGLTASNLRVVGRRRGLRLTDRRLAWCGPEHDIPVSAALLTEIILWIPYLLTLQWTKLAQSIVHGDSPILSFTPRKPSSWYLLMGAAAWGGIRTISQSNLEAHPVYFEDVTRSVVPEAASERTINGRCTDIRKSHVANIFEAIFGYPLAVDPTIFHGLVVIKPETNGTHAGCVTTAPVPPVSGYVYQRLIDTEDENNQCNDLRTPCIGGQPVLVWRKKKQANRRFGIQNQQASLCRVEDVYSPKEIAFIKRFNDAMGLDCGGLDILRDKTDGRIYVVDVNKTDLGPLIALPWSQKMSSMRILGAALRAWLIERGPIRPMGDEV